MISQLLAAIKSGLSVRYKLLLLVVLPLAMLTLTTIYVTSVWSAKTAYGYFYNQVKGNLQVVSAEFDWMRIDAIRQLTALGNGQLFLDSLKREDTDSVALVLDDKLETGCFDYINLLSADGTSKFTPDGWVPWQLPESSLTREIQSEGPGGTRVDIASGVEIHPREYWSKQPELDDDYVTFALVDTERASETTRTREDRAMIIRVLHRVLDADNQTIALLEGGMVMNNNYEVVDEIRDLVFGEGTLLEGSVGAVTLYLEDVRINTNVMFDDERRALGARASAEVKEHVLRDGEIWVERAHILDDWFISAYEPIVDVEGSIVGMLYAGYSEKPYQAQIRRGLALISSILIGGSLLVGSLAILCAQSIFKPVETISRVIRATALGERRRIGELNSGDEIGELARQFDYMLDTLEQNQARIEADAMHLEGKVRNRTDELHQKNQRLEESMLLVHETRQRLMMAEKLAAVGQLTAGVAHEINNPTAVILGNMDILLQEIGEARGDVQTEIDLIIQQVYRIRSITDSLLQYSRPGPEEAPFGGFKAGTTLDEEAALIASGISPMDDASTLRINAVINNCLQLVQHELQAKEIIMALTLHECLPVRVDRQEFQQVVVNLLSNAIDAVEHGGKISIISGADGATSWLKIKDDGKGIEADNLERLFDPFFTMGKQGGTGLGLAVSYGIVRRYQGHIDVTSAPGEGAEFKVSFPATELPQNDDKPSTSVVSTAAV